MLIQFALLALLLALSFFFSGSETALTASNKMKLQLRADQGDAKAAKVLKLVEKPDRMITSILIGNNIVNILLPTILTMIAIDQGWEVGLATTILTVILILFGEVLPKTIAATFAERISFVVYPAINLLVQILRPLTFLIAQFTNVFIRIISKGQVKTASLTKEDVRSIVDIASTEGTFEEDESLRLKGILDFPDKDVADVLETHRTEIIGVPLDASYEEVRDIILDNFYTRYPVYVESMDNIVGIFYSKKLIEWTMNPKRTLEEMMDREPLYVVQSVSVEKVFKKMLAKKKHMAIVLDEYGGTLGLVTNEDIIEEMIGQDIEDETDIEEDLLVFEMREGKLVCSGRMGIEEVNEMMKIHIDSEHDTIGGFVFEQLGHVPIAGEKFTHDNLYFEVNEMDHNRIKKVTITIREEEPEMVEE